MFCLCSKCGSRQCTTANRQPSPQQTSNRCWVDLPSRWNSMFSGRGSLAVKNRWVDKQEVVPSQERLRLSPITSAHFQNPPRNLLSASLNSFFLHLHLVGGELRKLRQLDLIPEQIQNDESSLSIIHYECFFFSLYLVLFSLGKVSTFSVE